MKIKLCGVRRYEDIEACNQYKPDYVGFVFANSKRQVSDYEAKGLREALDATIPCVGVFVDEAIERISLLCEEGVIQVVQLHGNENEDYIRQLKEKINCPIVKAIGITKKTDFEKLEKHPADRLLFDYKEAGSGKTFDWSLLKNCKREFFLAGGLSSENVEEAIAYLEPYGVDVSTLVETNGKKDVAKIKEFIEKARKAEKKMMGIKQGRFGMHGGQYIGETLMSEVIHLEKQYNFYKEDEEFNKELNELLQNYAGRPSLLYYAKKMTQDLGGAKIYLKREDLNHTGSHKINNVLGQVLMAKKMGKTRVIAETGAGQHGVATATAAALLGLECEIYMGKEDTDRQALNVYRMKLLGAKVHAVTSGTQTLKDAVNETMREWSNRISDTHYVLGSVMGPHPFPQIVRDFQSVISREAREQILFEEGKLPKAIYACVGGGSNAMGMFYHFIDDKEVSLIGCEAAGRGVKTKETAATIATGSIGIFHGMKSYFCQDEYGQIAPVYSISAGLDYPGIGPEHANLHDKKRANYVPITDDEAVEAFEYLARTEGIICAIESAHAVAQVIKDAKKYDKDDCIIVCLSGRGDKDVAAIARYRGEDINE